MELLERLALCLALKFLERRDFARRFVFTHEDTGGDVVIVTVQRGSTEGVTVTKAYEYATN